MESNKVETLHVKSSYSTFDTNIPPLHSFFRVLAAHVAIKAEKLTELYWFCTPK